MIGIKFVCELVLEVELLRQDGRRFASYKSAFGAFGLPSGVSAPISAAAVSLAGPVVGPVDDTDARRRAQLDCADSAWTS